MTKQTSGSGSNPSNPQTKIPSDTELVAHWSHVYDFIGRIVKHHELAEDITQDAFIKAWQHRAEYNPKTGELSTWICAIAKNEAIDRFRKTKTKPISFGEVSGFAEYETPDSETIARVSKILQFLDKQVNQYGVNPKYGTLLRHRFLGVESLELSEKFGVNRCTIRWRIHFARKLFVREWVKGRFTLKKAKAKARRKTRKRTR